jgi:predicted permease
MTLREIFGRLLAWRHREELDRELASELDAHIALLARDNEHAGMAPADALAAARRQIGNVTGLREQSREAWGFPPIERIIRDVRYAARGLRHSPGFTMTAILTLGLGIGANAAMFGVIDRVMFRPFPLMRDPASVNRVYLQTTYNGRVNNNTIFPYTRFLDLQRETKQFSEYAAVSEWRFGVGGEDARVRKVAGVSASFFNFFDAPPALGRYFVPAEDSIPMGALVAVISHALWTTDFASRDVIGNRLKVGKLDFTIIGVAPRGFVGTVSGPAPDVFVPITTIPANMGAWAEKDYFRAYNWDWTEVLVRRKPGVDAKAASADLTLAHVRSRAAARALNPRVLPDSLVQPLGIAGAVKTAAGPGAGLESKVLLWVTGVAVIVLLIACASVANLMFARVVNRRREISVRLSLGVSRRRLIGQFLIEGLLLALLGCAAGLVIAQWSGAAIRRLLLPEGSSFNLLDDWRTIGIAVACAIACTLLTALGPALKATRTDLASMLKSGQREGFRGRSRTQAALLVLQVSLSVVLLVGTGLFVRSLRNVRSVPLGYDARPVLEVIADYRNAQMTDSDMAAARRRLLADARALPGVAYVTPVSSGLFRTNTADLHVPGIDSVPALGRFNFQIGGPDYFAVMQTRILRGRGFTDADRAGSQLVTVVSQAMGSVLWPGEDPLGKCIHFSFGAVAAARRAPCTTVVGVAENTAQQNVADDPRYLYYLPMGQVAAEGLSTLLLRVSGPSAEEHVERVRRELTRAMPGDGFVVVRPLQEIVDDQSRSWRLGAALLLAFGGLAFVVAIVGLYGVISYNVAGRMHELGVRAALGARPPTLVTLVVGQGVRFALLGITIGVGLALIAARWVEPLLFRQSAMDPATYGAVAATMLIVAVAASLIPARRAARADPNIALRSE